MSDQDNRSGNPPNQPRTRFQQPGGKPPIGAISGTRVDRASDRASDQPEDQSSENMSDRSAPLHPSELQSSSESAIAPIAEPTPRPFPPTATLYADHPLTMTDRLQSLYDQAGLAYAFPKKWSLGVTLSVSDADMWDQLQASTLESLRSLLPITLHVTEVAAIVRDRQDYSAGWTIDPASLDEVRRARASVIASIQSLAPTLALLPLEPIISVAESVSALVYPSLIAAMQREFSRFAWSIDSFRFTPPEE